MQPALRPAERATVPSPESGTRATGAGVAAGHELGGYVLSRLLGRGGMGEVWSARCTRTGSEVAIKVPRSDGTNSARVRQLFAREAVLCSSLRHPNLLGALATGESNGVPFLVMPRVRGLSLSALQTRAQGQSAIPLDAMLHIATSLLDALDALHRHTLDGRRPTVHCDVSATNILVSTTGHVYLADFGIAQDAGERANGCGKRGTMSPEQIAGTEVDQRTDVFAAAVVIAQLLSGEPLYRTGADLEVLTENYAAGLPSWAAARCEPISPILARALSHYAWERYPSAGCMASALRARLAHLGTPVSRHSLARVVASLSVSHVARDTAETSPRPRYLHAMPSVRPVQYPGSGVRSILSARVAEAARQIATGDRPVACRDASAALLEGLATRQEYAPLPQEVPWLPLRAAPLMRCLAAIVEEKRTGALVVQDGPRWRRVYFRDGVVSLIASSDKSELIGERLIAANLATRTQVAQAVEYSLRTRTPIAAALAQSCNIPALRLMRELIAQSTARFLALGDHRSGQFAFLQGRRAAACSPRPSLSTEALVQRLARELDERDRATVLRAARR